MKVVVMAGGSGSRLGGVEKPLIKVCGRPMVEVALAAAAALGEPVLCVSAKAASVAELYCGHGIPCAWGVGDYVRDLSSALSGYVPALVLPADMPFIDLGVEILGEFMRSASSRSSDVVTLNACTGSVCHQPGISFFRSAAGGPWEDYRVPWDPSLMDVDTEGDLREAEGLCDTMVGGREHGSTSA